jgi:hypothetical protein
MQYRSDSLSKSSQPRNILIPAVAGTLLLAASACRETTTQPVLYRIDVPEAGSLQVEIELTQRIGLGLSGSYDIDIGGTRYARIFMEPESSSQGFRFGFDLNLGIFIPETVGSFEKTTVLPTGQTFSSWVQTPMVELTIPEANLPELSWNFYFGTQGRIAVGAAATISAINGSFPSISLEYAFRDNQGRLILGVQFYGPGRDGNGNSVPGGIFLGTDLTELLPKEALAYLPAKKASGAELASASELNANFKALRKISEPGKALKASGKSAFREMSLRGRDAGTYRRAPERLKTVIGRMLEQTRR